MSAGPFRLHRHPALGALWIGFFASQVGAPWAAATGAAAAGLLMLPIASRLVARAVPPVGPGR